MLLKNRILSLGSTIQDEEKNSGTDMRADVCVCVSVTHGPMELIPTKYFRVTDFEQIFHYRKLGMF